MMKHLSSTFYKRLLPRLTDSPSRAAVHSRGGPVLCRGRQDVWSSPRSLGSGTTSKHWWWNGRDHARINWHDCQEIRYESNSICQTGTPLITEVSCYILFSQERLGPELITGFGPKCDVWNRLSLSGFVYLVVVACEVFWRSQSSTGWAIFCTAIFNKIMVMYVCLDLWKCG